MVRARRAPRSDRGLRALTPPPRPCPRPKMGQLQPFTAVFPPKCMGQLASFGHPTCIFWANLTPFSRWPACADPSSVTMHAPGRRGPGRTDARAGARALAASAHRTGAGGVAAVEAVWCTAVYIQRCAYYSRKFLVESIYSCVAAGGTAAPSGEY
jgi:hypothetical protein